MKKKILLILGCLLFIAVPCFAAVGTVAQTATEVRDGSGNVTAKIVTFACVGSDVNGAIPDTATSTLVTKSIKGWFLDMVIADPGATTPDDDSDVYIKNANGLDLLGGNGVDLLHSTTTKGTVPATDGQNKQQSITGTLTLDVDNQTAVDAIYSIVLIFVR